MIKFSKYHALGNDYLILDPCDIGREPSPREVRLICHRNFGIGSDGILFGPLPAETADFGLRIFNPDGGEAEKSGNGLRIFSRYLRDRKRVASDPFTVMTPGGLVTCQVSDGGEKITVAMGRVRFTSADIPVTGAPREVLDEAIEADGETLRYYGATIGNPHCVIPLQEISESEARRLGPVLENHPAFPNRINIQLLKVIDRNNIQIEIWERGAGYTLASGSSSSAAAAVAYKMGAVDSNILVHMPGGCIEISIDRDFAVTMSGPATRVGLVEFDEGALNEKNVE